MEVPLEKLQSRIGNEYQLVIVAAKRTRQIAGGVPKLVDIECSKQCTVALWEIAEGKIKYVKIDKEDEGEG